MVSNDTANFIVFMKYVGIQHNSKMDKYPTNLVVFVLTLSHTPRLAEFSVIELHSLLAA